MEEDEVLDQDLMEYSQASREDAIPMLEGLGLKEMAQGVAGHTSSSLKENDEVILQTEHILDELSQHTEQDSIQQAQLLSRVTQSLLGVWRHAYPLKPSNDGIGPGRTAQAPAKALFLASLILQIHHPPTQGPPPRAATGLRQRTDPIPKVLLGWLERHHWPFETDFDEAFNYQPNPASHERFWDIIYNTILRGNVKDACDLLGKAELDQAATALNDGSHQKGYRGQQLHNAQKVVQRAIGVLKECPAAQSGDWNVKGSGWMVFRRKVREAMTDLQSFAEGNNADRYSDGDSNFEASHFGMSASPAKGLSVSKRSRQAESRVPWTIYQNLMYLYGQLLGTPSELTAASGDWVEATIGMATWWDGEDADVASRELTKSRRFSKSSQRHDRLVDIHPQAAYIQRLVEALVILKDGEEDDAELQIDPTDAVQVGLGCAMGNELDGLILIIRSWSPIIATAVVEVADRGGWLGRARHIGAPIDGFNKSDLMVLSYARQEGAASDHDTALSAYADLLFKHRRLQGHNADREGWQVAIEVLGRLHDEDAAEKKIGELLDQLDLRDTAEVNEAVRLCSRIGLQNHARRISEASPTGLLCSSEILTSSSAMAITSPRRHICTALRSITIHALVRLAKSKTSSTCSPR